MADMCLLGLIFLCPLLTGLNGAEMTYVFCGSGENVRLPCNNSLSDCTSTTWTYSKQSNTVELIAGGIKKKDVERHERLSLGSDCSLNIQKITEKDRGLYTCQQYVNRPPSDAPVYLHVLYVSSSSQSEISPGSSVTLFCQLFYDGVSCDALVRAEGVQLIWVNQTGVNLQTDPRYKISFSSEHCYSSLTTRLLREDLNREWTCQVTQRNKVKTSASYTVKYSTPFETKTVAPVTSSLTTTVTFTPPVIGIGVAAAALALLLPAVILWVICKKRADKRRVANDAVDTNMNTYDVPNNTINISINPTPGTNEQNDDVTYTEVATYNKTQAKQNQVNADKVTYAAITVTAKPQDNCSQLYASVNKNHHK